MNYARKEAEKQSSQRSEDNHAIFAPLRTLLLCFFASVIRNSLRKRQKYTNLRWFVQQDSCFYISGK